ncbi:MAG: hypothetical protein PVF82_20715 [Gammaproteobacteria bacterium]
MTTKNCRMFCLASLLMFASFTVFADSPKTIENPDSHSVEVKGKIKLYRVQVENMNLGEGKNAADAEVFVTLDSKPGMVYALQIKGNTPPSNQVIADTLRDAYINNIPVTLYHQIAIGRDNNFKILMVQLDR